MGIAGTDYLRSNAFTFDEETEHNKRVLWEYLCVFMYAIWASVLTKYIGTAVEYLVRLENHSEQAEEDYFGLFESPNVGKTITNLSEYSDGIY